MRHDIKIFANRKFNGALTTQLITACMVSLIAVPSVAMAQSEDPSIQDLQRQINAMESKHHRQIESLQKRINSLQKANTESQTVTKPKITKINNKETTFHVGSTAISIGGFVDLDLTEQFNQDTGRAPVPMNLDPHVSNGGKGGHFSIQAQHSRLTLATKTPTQFYGPVSSYFSFDLQGSGGNETASNSYGLRLRQAYLEWNHFLFGQAWSVFEDFHVPPQVDYYSTIGSIQIRQPQIRYTFDLGDNKLAIALENPDTKALGENGTIAESNKQIDLQCGPGLGGTGCGAQNTAPDVVARFLHNDTNLSYQIAALGTRLKLDGASGDKVAYGWGLDAGGSYKLPTDTTFYLMGTYGHGNNRYIQGPRALNAYVDNKGDISAPETWSVVGGIKQGITPKWFTSLGYSYLHEQDLSNIKAVQNTSCNFRTSRSASGTSCLLGHASQARSSLFFQATPDLQFGGSYIYSAVEYQDGAKAHNSQVWFRTKYSF